MQLIQFNVCFNHYLHMFIIRTCMCISNRQLCCVATSYQSWSQNHLDSCVATSYQSSSQNHLDSCRANAFW